MRVLILGGDGYLGWPTAMHFAVRGHEVSVIDNYLRRTIALETDSEPLFRTPPMPQRAEAFAAASGHRVAVHVGDCRDYDTLRTLVRDTQPDVVVHYAEQPSGPYSMRDYGSAKLTLDNNLQATFNLAWAVIEEAPQAHIVKLGTMGEYGTPNIDIEEGWIEIEHKGRRDTFLYPRQAGSLYHTTKVLDTDLLWFYVRTFGIRVTDLMQGPVYGLRTPEADLDARLLPNFHYDDIFGTVVNRFLTQAVAGIPLTVYGKGGQTRGGRRRAAHPQPVHRDLLGQRAGGEGRAGGRQDGPRRARANAGQPAQGGRGALLQPGAQRVDRARAAAALPDRRRHGRPPGDGPALQGRDRTPQGHAPRPLETLNRPVAGPRTALVWRTPYAGSARGADAFGHRARVRRPAGRRSLRARRISRHRLRHRRAADIGTAHGPRPDQRGRPVGPAHSDPALHLEP
jgi:nucleoside-diphosphate-sugar epimerase